MCRSAATGAGVGDENAADPVEAVLPGREAEPTRAVYQGGRGERTSSLSSLIGVPHCRRLFYTPVEKHACTFCMVFWP